MTLTLELPEDLASAVRREAEATQTSEDAVVLQKLRETYRALPEDDVAQRLRALDEMERQHASWPPLSDEIDAEDLY